MKKRVKILSLIISMTFSAFAEENFYIDEYGSATLVPAKVAYPDFPVTPPLPPVLDRIFVVIASKKQVKIDAVMKLFEMNPRFAAVETAFLLVEVSSDIADQPIGIANGRLGALNRINTIQKNRKASRDHKNTYVCAIENYFEEENVVAPRDHAFVMMQSPDGQLFEAVSVGVQIDRAVYDDAISGAKRVINDEGLFTGYSKTVGSYLKERYDFESGDWFKEVGAGIDRIDQILTTLDDGPWF